MFGPDIIQLSNQHFQLQLLPSFGCHWMSLKLQHEREWLDVLSPAPDVDSLRENPFRWGSFLMAPWCNRIPHGQFSFDGYPYLVKPNFKDGSAMHGDVYRHPWIVKKVDPHYFLAELVTLEAKDFNYPFPLQFFHELILTPEALIARLGIHNISLQPVPVGAGFHSTFKRWLRPEKKDPLKLVLPAQKAFMPAGPYPVPPAVAASTLFPEVSPWDLSRQFFDHTFAGLPTNVPVKLLYSDSWLELQLMSNVLVGHMFVYSPANHEGQPADFTCIEPMSMMPNGLQLLSEGSKDTGVAILDPGQSLKIEMRLSFGYPI